MLPSSSSLSPSPISIAALAATVLAHALLLGWLLLPGARPQASTTALQVVDIVLGTPVVPAPPSPAPAPALRTRAAEESPVLPAGAPDRSSDAERAPATAAVLPPADEASAAATVPERFASSRPPAAAVADDPGLPLSILAHLAHHRVYPRAARRAGIEGTVEVRFVIDREGRLLETELLRSSGHALLDRAAMTLLEQAAPYPRLLVSAPSIELRLPLEYRLLALR